MTVALTSITTTEAVGGRYKSFGKRGVLIERRSVSVFSASVFRL
jgi:hypothetical protein